MQIPRGKAGKTLTASVSSYRTL